MVKHTPRFQETRQSEEHAKNYAPPSHLPDPNPRDGIVHRWIRFATLGKDDPVNVSVQSRDGWVPVKKDEYPEFTGFGEEALDNTVKLGGLILCKMPEERARQRDAYYNSLTRQQLKSVESQLMKESNPRMPIMRPDKRSDVSFGGGSKLSNFTDQET
jgi:hypothetical protein